MIMQIPRWRNVILLKSSLVPASSQSKTTRTHFASIHSTPIACDKRKSKRGDDKRGFQQPSKDYIKFVRRQKRADEKRALKDFLYNDGPLRTFQHKDPIWSSNAEPPVGSRKRNEKAYARSAKKYHQDRTRSKLREDSSAEDSGEPETVFHATFGSRWYTWSNKSCQREPSGFEWRESPRWKDQRYREWDANRETESDNASYSVGSHSDRTILGLPLTGPLKIEDVKNAFRLSALKWHPDKHQGASQAAAGERFKLCVDAYKSLCDALA
ncbi:chaperone DnaJ-domain superfamily protein [Salix suchowensis]|nr:chaperone DnaJ-domain superfamily protein [Salix suchowensis]